MNAFNTLLPRPPAVYLLLRRLLCPPPLSLRRPLSTRLSSSALWASATTLLDLGKGLVPQMQCL